MHVSAEVERGDWRARYEICRIATELDGAARRGDDLRTRSPEAGEREEERDLAEELHVPPLVPTSPSCTLVLYLVVEAADQPSHRMVQERETDVCRSASCIEMFGRTHVGQYTAVRAGFMLVLNRRVLRYECIPCPLWDRICCEGEQAKDADKG